MNKQSGNMFLFWALVLVIAEITSPAQAQLNYYFGNIHAHTGFSDGNKDASVTGVNDAAGSFAYAKQSLNFNFLGISEHNHFSNPNNPGFTVSEWPLLVSQANAANQDGTFLCMAGMEWGVSSTYNGHVLVYNYPQLLGWESGNYQVFNAKTDYDGLWRKINQQPGAFAYLAHPSFSDYTTNGSSSTSLLNGAYVSAYDSAIVGMPFRSGLAFSTDTNYSDYPGGNYMDYYKRILCKGYHMGIGYDHDNHYLTFGRNNAGRLVVMAPALTRNDFYNAMRQMKFYGSDDWNAKISFSMGTSVMGDITSGTVAPTFNIVHNDMDGEQADSIIVWTGVSGGTNILPTRLGHIKSSNTYAVTDNVNLVPGQERFYFVEIKQPDGQIIVTSPIWYTYTGVTGLNNHSVSTLKTSVFPNPARQILNISSNINGEALTVTIYAPDGKEIKRLHSETPHLSIPTDDLKKGLYLLTIAQGLQKQTQKLVIE
ncbi:MAG: T9SS type A sorting domain-containing protein [Sediminibacterium sp.]|nr:T9SS type A sorting domain-containing protein [Sediminibacterium sp.]